MSAHKVGNASEDKETPPRARSAKEIARVRERSQGALKKVPVDFDPWYSRSVSEPRCERPGSMLIVEVSRKGRG